MRYYCHFCHVSVTSEVPDETVVRAILICPECLEEGKLLFPDDTVHITWDDKGNRIVARGK